MMTHRFFKAPFAATLGALLLAGCYSAETSDVSEAVKTPTATAKNLAPIRTALSCLPQDAAIVAAHRGVDERRADLSENSIGGLKALIAHGSIMAEIDVAGTKDGALFTFHDGVWDDMSTGTGPVAATTAAQLDTILLKSRAGEITADRPPLFSDLLQTAKGKIYIEVDFKSSADPKDVIDAVRAADMTDQVLLIAYNPDQAAELERLAPDMLRSNPTSATQAGHAVWLGYDVAKDDRAKSFKSQGNYTIGRIGDPNRQPPLDALRLASDILVTDEAEKYDAIIGLTPDTRATYEACLAKG